MPTPENVVASSRAVMVRHARSFTWASWFLPADRRDDAAVIYAWCRAVDDDADEAPDVATAERALARWSQSLGDPAGSVLSQAFVEVCRRRDIPLQAAEELLNGCRSDLQPVQVASDGELLRYAYRVAGTVGLMMCGVLGVRDPRALAHAIDLGVAMQLTNICRDVAEDAARGRVYLPADRLGRVGVLPSQLLAGSADRAAVARVVADLLDLAERYYRSGEQGMRYIPARSRLAILVASRVYRAIGKVLAKRGHDALAGRASVSRMGKLRETVGACWDFFTLTWRQERPHERELHRWLAGLPGVLAEES